MTRRFVCAAALLLAAPAAFAMQEKRSTAAGAYTSAQATRGERAFISNCGGCHTPDQFVGEFLHAWDGKAAGALLDMIKTKMPQDAPGSLPRQDYADILAFLFEKNGLPDGTIELPAAEADLALVTIERKEP